MVFMKFKHKIVKKLSNYSILLYKNLSPDGKIGLPKNAVVEIKYPSRYKGKLDNGY